MHRPTHLERLDEQSVARLEKLEAREQWLSQLFHRNPYPVALFDRQGHLREHNEAFVRYWMGHLPPPEYSVLDDPLAKRQLGDDFIERWQAGEACRTEEFWWNPGQLNPQWPDMERCVVLVLEPVRTAEGELDGFMMIYDDRTELKRLQEQVLKQQKLESIGLLAARVAHDFNNYLTSLMGHATLGLQELDDPESVGNRFQRIRAVTEAASALTYQLITYARGGAPIRELVALGPLVEETVGFTSRGSSVELDLDIPEDLWVIEADAGQLRQVVSNIALNGLQAMGHRGKLTVSARNISHDEQRANDAPIGRGSYVEVSIRDTGPGIPADRRPDIFEPFFTTRTTGQGLGLYTARSIVEKHFGRLVVQSPPGGGAQFDLYLPALPFAEPQTQPSAQVYRGSGTVLFIDDDAELRLATTDMLIYLGYDVHAVAEGGTAIQRLDELEARGQAVDLILTDLTIRGGMGGEELIEALKERADNLPVVVSSGYSDGPVLARFREHGFSARLLKPYTLQELSRVLYEQLNPRPPAVEDRE